ncbi:hypothetical protein B0O80DRAFT_465143 [Mortierella sp. GBAus27b]|nr:hypothetical protein B0O80DRAFT_465143 [Mortierella sp. GBAus27b]
MESGNILNRKAVKSFNRFLEYRPPLTTLTLRLKVKYSLEKTTTDILSRLATLQSLTINRGELTVTTNIMEDKTRDVDLTIERVDNILSDDVTFIKHDQLTRLAIKFTPQETDESQLISILRRKPRLMHLQLGSEASRALAIVNLVISAREEILREGEASGLHTFELMEEKLIPFDENGDRDESSHIQTHVSFTDDSFDMRTWIRLEDRACLTENHPLHGFVRQYGWSIDFMEEDWAHHSAFAAIFDEIPGTRGFMLETLSLEVSGFTTLDFERLDLIIQQSPNFKQLGLCIKPARMDLSEIACRMLKRYGPRLFKLHLHGVFSAQWLQKFASFFPSRASFPNLRCFEVSFETGCEVSDDCVRWITELISAPSQVSASSSSAQTLLQCNFEQSIPWKRVRKIMLPHIDLKPEQWKVFIDAIDFTELQHLDLRDSNLRPDGFNQLVNRIPGFKAPLRTLSLEHTDIGTSSRKLKSVIADLREKVPEAKILTTTSKLRPMLALRWKQS